VLDYTWSWDGAKREVVLTVKQLQDLKEGTPLYNLRPTVGLIADGKLTRVPTTLDKAAQEIRIGASGKPDAVLLDPDQDILREIPTRHWTAEELPHILRYAPNAVDRGEALHRLLAGTPSDATIAVVVETLRADSGANPVFPSLDRLGDLK